MQLCPSCNKELSERAIFCSWCGLQAKCKACGDILDSGARFCVSCGTPVGEGNPIQTEHTGTPPRNVIEFSEDSKSRHFRAEVSDSAIDSVSQPLALFLGTRILKPVSRSQKQTYRLDKIIDSNLDETEESENIGYSKPEEALGLPAGTDIEVLRRIFRRTGDDKLRLNDSRLKQSNQRDFVKRLTSLFLYAHELEGQEFVPRSDLNAALSDAKIYDANARTWITKTEYIDQDGDLVTLTLPGRDYAQKVLKEYLNPQIEGTWSSESKTRRRITKQPNEKERESGEEGTTRRGRKVGVNSYTNQVRAIFDQGFFTQGRTGQDVQSELKRLGYNFELRRINEALVKLVKKGNLTRNEEQPNKWIYQNRNPL